MYAEERSKFIGLVRDTLASLCREHLPFISSFEIDGLIGITMDKDDVFLVKFNECTTSLMPETQPKRNTMANVRVIEPEHDPMTQVAIIPGTSMTEEGVIETLPIIVKQEGLVAETEEGEVLLDTSGMILETTVEQAEVC
jgi:hypothetical protein